VVSLSNSSSDIDGIGLYRCPATGLIVATEIAIEITSANRIITS
jgi:hypothetical protein